MDEKFIQFMLGTVSEFTLHIGDLELRKKELEDGLPKLSDLKGTMPDDGIPSEEFVRKLRDEW